MSEIIVKIKGFLSISQKKRLVIKEYCQSCVSAILLLSVLGMPMMAPVMAYAANTTSATTTTDINALARSISGQNLPIGSISIKSVPNAKGIAIYFPQVHQNPGSQVSDPANDSAVQAQTEMKTIMSSLAANSGVKLLMAEGDLYGPIAADKMTQIKNKMDAESDLSARIGELNQMLAANSLDSSNESAIVSQLNQADSYAKRALILKGAAYLVAAGQGGMTIYGAENKDTYDKSADLVRKYFYLEDRLAQVQGRGSVALQSSQGPSAPSGSALNSMLTKEVSLAESSGRTDLTAMYQGLDQDIQTLNQADIIPNAPTSAPSRSDNPYASISNPAILNQLMQQDESQIETTVINERSIEAADYFASGLVAENQTVGILQFGAGHESSLVPELNKQGLSVLIVTSSEVAKSSGAVQNQPAQRPMPIPKPMIVPTPVPTPVVTPVLTPEVTPTSTPEPTIAPTPAPEVTPAVSANPVPECSTPEPTPTPVPTITPTPEATPMTSCAPTPGLSTPEPTMPTTTPVSASTSEPAPAVTPAPAPEVTPIAAPEPVPTYPPATAPMPPTNDPVPTGLHFFPTVKPVTLPDGTAANGYTITTYSE